MAASSGMSKDTQRLLKDMMAKSGLTPYQQRQLQQAAQQGAALPTDVGPTSKRKEPRNVAPKSKAAPAVQRGPPKMSRRQLSAIQQTDAYARERFQADTTGSNRAHEKERLYDTMAFGKDTAAAKAAIKARGTTRVRPAAAAAASSAAAISPQDEFDETLREIEERRAYLENMHRARKATPALVAEVNRDISVRIRRLETLDAAVKAAAAQK